MQRYELEDLTRDRIKTLLAERGNSVDSVKRELLQAYQPELDQLLDMGFVSVSACVSALRKFDLDIDVSNPTTGCQGGR